MPKRISVSRSDGRITRIKLPSKHRVGTRKGGVSAHTLSNDQLMGIVDGNNHKRDIRNAQTVLSLRGV